MLHIPKPCNENWENMDPNEKGRHCLSCQKTVHDFTNWETQDIADYIKNRGSVCVRLNEEQLAPKRSKSWRFISARVAAGLTMVLALFPAFGQQKKKPKAQKPVVRDNEPILMGDIIYVPDSLVKKDTVRLKPTKPPIMGKIKMH